MSLILGSEPCKSIALEEPSKRLVNQNRKIYPTYPSRWGAQLAKLASRPSPLPPQFASFCRPGKILHRQSIVWTPNPDAKVRCHPQHPNRGMQLRKSRIVASSSRPRHGAPRSSERTLILTRDPSFPRCLPSPSRGCCCTCDAVSMDVLIIPGSMVPTGSTQGPASRSAFHR